MAARINCQFLLQKRKNSVLFKKKRFFWAGINLRLDGKTRKRINQFLSLRTDIEHLSQQLMAKLAVPPMESSAIFIDDPTARHSALGPRQIEVRCVYLDDIIGKRVYVVCLHEFLCLSSSENQTNLDLLYPTIIYVLCNGQTMNIN